MKTCRKGLHRYSDELTRCPECVKVAKKAYNLANQDKIRSQNKQKYDKNAESRRTTSNIYRRNNMDSVLETNRRWRANNVKHCQDYHSSYYIVNKEKINICSQHWSKLNKEHLQQLNKKWNIKNKEHKRSTNKHWIQNNKDRCNTSTAKRRATKLNATPKWLTQDQLEQIAEFYTLAHHISKQTGIKQNVDHVIPLQGEEVCGLHVPWNLQVIPAVDNLSKGNRLNL